MRLIKLNGFDEIYYVDGLIEEYDKITHKSKVDLSLLVKKLYKLNELRYAAIRIDPKNFEKLVNVNSNIFCIRFNKRLYNQRVLYFILKDNKIVLLKAFSEKKKSDYDKNIKIVNRLIKEISNLDN